ncbi:MAG: hypothetical protein NC218_10540 [Acetobacter sp.]|nr:hypothetical protein [Acetobacter sp.]
MDLFLLICHRSERSEVKRSRESMVGYLWIATSLTLLAMTVAAPPATSRAAV